MNHLPIKRLAILIVNYDGEPFIKDCIDSIFAIDKLPIKIDVILVDNKSKDASLETIEKSILALSPESISQIIPQEKILLSNV